MVKESKSIWCSILNYLENKYSKIAKLINELCVEQLLVPSRFRRGITFLAPKDDSEIVKSIEKYIKDDSVESVNKAHEMICSLIIFKALMTPKDWIEESKKMELKVVQCD